MADLSGVCDNHGIVVFNHDDGAAIPDPNNTLDSPNYLPDLAVGWYWASCQHNVLTGKPNGPHGSRTAALADAVRIMSAHDSATVLQGSDLGS